MNLKPVLRKTACLCVCVGVTALLTVWKNAGLSSAGWFIPLSSVLFPATLQGMALIGSMLASLLSSADADN